MNKVYDVIKIKSDYIIKFEKIKTKFIAIH